MYLFFIRAFNDIDHITPIVWKMKRDDFSVAVYCINPEYDIKNDYRLNFLKGLGIKVDFIYNDFDQALGLMHRSMRFLFLRIYDLQRKLDINFRSILSVPLNKLRELIRRTGNQIYKLSRKRFYTKNWALDILEKTEAEILCFDWIRPERYVVDVFLQAAKELAIPTLALPHGVYLYTNDFIKIGVTEERICDKHNRYDYVVVQNHLFKHVMCASGVDSSRIHVLGSARYCGEWMAQNRKILPRMVKRDSESKGRLKVVFMTTRPAYRVNVERLLKTFEILSNFEDIEVVIKPHTRTGREADMYNSLPLSNVSNVSSVELCEWADVVLVIGSSIIVEALAQKKPALYLKYLHENTMEYEEYGACWVIRDESELEHALLSMQNGNRNVPYADGDVSRWLSEIVYGGRSERDVLKDYELFIRECAKR
jgi:hypothetical protein